MKMHLDATADFEALGARMEPAFAVQKIGRLWNTLICETSATRKQVKQKKLKSNAAMNKARRNKMRSAS